MEIDPVRSPQWTMPGAQSLINPDRQIKQDEFFPAVQAVNEAALFGEQYELKFDVDAGSRRTLVRLVDRDTQEVVRQLPPEYVLRLARELSRRNAR